MNIHFIAIGGAAMHNLAIALKLVGHHVTGSDDEIFDPSKSRLAKWGLLPEEFGWYPEKLTNNIDAIILGMHARPDNPELLYAQELGLKIYSFPEFLYNHSRDKKRVVIGGSHGKTTITAMIMHVLKSLNMDFDYLVGSKIRDFDVMARLSNDAPIMIFEGDEYLSSPIDRRPKFHWYSPHIALLSGIAWDHINVFPTFENYVEQFDKFISIIEEGGSLVYSYDDKGLRELVSKHKEVRSIPYSYCNYRISNGISYIVDKDEEIPLKIFGRHNMMNLNGARLICNELGISDDVFYKSICKFEGTANRLELIHKTDNGLMYKDFAHAPSKVKATVDSVREQFPSSRFFACLELHTFSSLNRDFIDEYENALNSSDYACVYFNEHTLKMKQLPQLSVKDVKNAFNRHDLEVTTEPSGIENWLRNNKAGNCVYLFMSSGNFRGLDFNKLGTELLG